MIAALDIEITQQVLFSGIVTGLVYAVLAAGFVLVYRSTGVLNFAQGEIGAFGVALFTLLQAGYGVPYWLAFAMAVACSAAIGTVTEMIVVRRLFNAPRLVLLIATLGVAQLLLVARLMLPNTAASKQFPLPFHGIWHPTAELTVLAREVLVLVVAPVAIIGLALFMTHTKLGLLVRASASNPDTARVYGISVRRTSTIVWTIAGAFAGLTAILYAPIRGITPGTIIGAGAVAIGPSLLLRALVVSLIARLRSLPMCLVGGLAVGVAESIVIASNGGDRTIVELYLFLATLALVLFTNRSVRPDANWTLTSNVKPVPERLRSLWYVRHLSKLGYAVLFGSLAILPFFLSKRSQESLWTDVLLFAMAALPISMLIGWAGQVSLGQFAFVGLGACTMVVLTHDLDIPVPFDLWTMHFELSWLPALVISTAVGVVLALLMGLPALRARGLMLAVVTFAFAVAATQWLFAQSVWTGDEFATNMPSMEKPELLGIDFSNRRSFYYLCLACLFLMAMMTARLRRTGIGRSMIAVRDNEEMAAASTVSATRMKLSAFAISGGMAAFSGCLFVTAREFVQPTSTFDPDSSLRLVSTAIIGGLGSVAGPIIGALFVRGLPTIFDDVSEVQLATSGIGLLILLMYFPGGLMQILYALRNAILGWAERRLPAAEPRAVPAAPAALTRDRPAHAVSLATPGAAWLSVSHVT
ncbi:MAG TPA: ABC transporter permease, partial [Acidimicrobiia bacterium]|nr:ABC transporter permease [Acidimicrobiia bacterium]